MSVGYNYNTFSSGYMHHKSLLFRQPQINPNQKKKEKNLKTQKVSKMIRQILCVLLFMGLSMIEAAPSSIYDQLKNHGLPIGILPKGITEYFVDPASGFFRINLTAPCNAQFENQLHYDFNISGHLSYGQIAELSGVSQQDLFLWFPVKAIRVDVPSSGLIYFDVGVADKKLSLSLFENPRDCTAVDPDPDHGDSQYQSINHGHEIGPGGKLRADS